MSDLNFAEVQLNTSSPEETLELGARLGELLFPGAVVALTGDLGSGKTLLTKGIARGLGVRQYRYVSSPTFVIKQEYVGRLRIHHYDTYRLGSPDELEALGFREDVFSEGVVIVEWADRVSNLIPGNALHVTLEHGAVECHETLTSDAEVPDNSQRTLVLRGVEPGWSGAIEKLKFPYSPSRNTVE